jgi:tetratricopeptide (TPR) repeat protein
MSDEKKTCFVVMGFGKKTDFETGRTLDLDKTYRNIIKPAVKAAGLECIRADEIVHSGLIDVPMYKQLLNADVVVADLSTSNKNAYYELGVRHALKPYTTIILCEDGIKTFPFDVNHVAVRQYRHLGEGIDSEEVDRMRDMLASAIVTISQAEKPDTDSPVYTFLNGLTPPALAAAMDAVAEAVAKSAPAVGVDPEDAAEPAAADPTTETHGVLMQQVDEAQKAGKFLKAKALLEIVRDQMKPEDADAPMKPEYPYIIQRLALVTYKAKYDTAEEQIDALREARSMLAELSPDISNDTETLGLWGAVHKRLWEQTGDRGALDEAVRGYERGFYLRNDYYNGINLAYLLNVRADNAASRAEAIADFVQAERIRREVLAICEAEMKDGGPSSDEQKYWILATEAEALLGVGDEKGAQQKFDEAVALIPDPKVNQWMKASTKEQMDKLRAFLARSPLKYVRDDGE